MRESFGGAFMIKLVLVFIVIYISFMAVAVNFAKTFRIKNHIINILEQNQYTGTSTDDAWIKIEEYTKTAAYNINQKTSNQLSSKCANQGGIYRSGVCITTVSSSNNKAVYKVTVFVVIDFSFFSINMTVPISGETKTIYIS